MNILSTILNKTIVPLVFGQVPPQNPNQPSSMQAVPPVDVYWQHPLGPNAPYSQSPVEELHATPLIPGRPQLFGTTMLNIPWIPIDIYYQIREQLDFKRAEGFGMDIRNAEISFIDCTFREIGNLDNNVTLQELEHGPNLLNQMISGNVTKPETREVKVWAHEGIELGSNTVMVIKDSRLYLQEISVKQRGGFLREWEEPGIILYDIRQPILPRIIPLQIKIKSVKHSFREPTEKVDPVTSTFNIEFEPVLDEINFDFSIDPRSNQLLFADRSKEQRIQRINPRDWNFILDSLLGLGQINPDLFAIQIGEAPPSALDQKRRIFHEGGDGKPLSGLTIPVDLDSGICPVDVFSRTGKRADSKNFALGVWHLAPGLDYFRPLPGQFAIEDEGNSIVEIAPLDYGSVYILGPTIEEAEEARLTKTIAPGENPLSLRQMMSPLTGIHRVLKQFIHEGTFNFDNWDIALDYSYPEFGFVNLGQILGSPLVEYKRVPKSSLIQAMKLPADSYPDLVDFPVIKRLPRSGTKAPNQFLLPHFLIYSWPRKTGRIPSLNIYGKDIALFGNIFWTSGIPTEPFPNSSFAVNDLRLSSGPMQIEDVRSHFQLAIPGGMYVNMERLSMGQGYGRFIDYITEMGNNGTPVPNELKTGLGTQEPRLSIKGLEIWIPHFGFRIVTDAYSENPKVFEGYLKDFYFTPELSILGTDLIEGAITQAQLTTDENILERFLRGSLNEQSVNGLLEAIRTQLLKGLGKGGMIHYSDNSLDMIISGQPERFVDPQFQILETPNLRSRYRDLSTQPLKLHIRMATSSGFEEKDVVISNEKEMGGYVPRILFNGSLGQMFIEPNFGSNFIGARPTDQIHPFLLAGVKRLLFQDQNLAEDSPQMEKVRTVAAFLTNNGYVYGSQDPAQIELNRSKVWAFLERYDDSFPTRNPADKRRQWEITYRTLEFSGRN